MLHDYNIEISNSNRLKDNTMLNCSMELSLLNNLFRENLITEAEQHRNVCYCYHTGEKSNKINCQKM